MKMKIFALVMAVFCLSSLLVGCTQAACETHKDSDTNGICDVCEATLCEQHADAEPDGVCDACAATIPVPCSPHKDENADKICDSCKNAIVVLLEQIAPEEEKRVDMVVATIPENVNLQEFVITTVDRPTKITTMDQLDITEVVDTEGNVWAYYSNVSDPEGETYERYSIYDFEQGKELLPNVNLTTQPDSLLDVKTVNIDLDNYYFTVAVSSSRYNMFDELELQSASLAYYTYEGEEICNFSWNKEASNLSLMEWAADIETESYELNGVTYITFDNKIWAFDNETKEILLKEASPMSLVHRPAFDSVCEGKYGYVEKDGKILVYDLNSWIECVYSYDIPQDYYYNSWFVLENGNLLVQGLVYLPSDAISYDFISNETKHDIVYTILDPAAKTATAVEFGYFVAGIKAPSEDIFTDKVANVATMIPIVDDMLSDELKTVALNNDLTIAADLTDVLELELVNDGVFHKHDLLDDLAYADYIVDVNGKEIAYIPYDAEIKENYIAYDNKVYSFKMEERFDLSEYEVVFEDDSFMILYSEDPMTGGFYHYSIRENDLSNLEHQPILQGVDNYDFGYIVFYEMDEAFNSKFAIYNENNELLLDNVGFVAYDIYEIGDFYILKMSDGTYYIAK